jgi:hypothetical protein
MKYLVLAFIIAGLGTCSNKTNAQTVMATTGTGIVAPSPNYSVYIEQVGDNNTVAVTQQDDHHRAAVTLGKQSAADSNAVTITQRDPGQKTAAVDLPSGINNTVNINQQGLGQHNTGIINLNGSVNNIAVDQSGDGNHTFTVLGAPGTTNSGNTITATQSGGVGADKNFQLNMNGTSGANVSVTQSNPTQPNTGSMSITCSTGSCGNYTYTRY